MLLKTLRRLRHGPLKRFNSMWLLLGKIYRFVVGHTKLIRLVKIRVGRYGPFKFNAYFAFSDFEHWGKAHNNAFDTCIQLCQKKSCVVDVGAHIGLVTMPMSRAIGKKGQVIAFEPALMNLQYLREHVTKNKLTNVKVYDCLIGDVDKDKVEFYEQKTPTGMNSIVIKKQHQNYIRTFKKQMTMDTFFEGSGLSPAVIKIDVEGAEINVLTGALKVIENHRPFIFLSVHPQEIDLLGQTLEELKDIIQSIHYEVFNPDGTLARNFELKEYILKPIL